MTNPNSAVGTNAGYNGRTTPNALNDILAAFKNGGIVSGWTCSPKSGMTVQIGGDGSNRDVAIAMNNSGDYATINNRSGQPIDITIDGAPASNNRIDTIVAYVNNPQLGTGSSDTDFPSQCGIISVKGTVAQTPSNPTEAQIKTAITADGGDGSTAYYVHLADIYVGQGVTSITSGNITKGTAASLSLSATIPNGAIGTNQLASSAVTAAKLASNAVETAKIKAGAVTEAKLDRTSFVAPVANGLSIANTTAPTDWTDKTTLDITNIPTGSKFVVIVTLWARCTTAPATLCVRAHYDTNYSYVAWSGADDVEGLHSGTAFGVFTKASGKNTVYAQILALSGYHIDDGHADIVAIPC